MTTDEAKQLVERIRRKAHGRSLPESDLALLRSLYAAEENVSFMLAASWGLVMAMDRGWSWWHLGLLVAVPFVVYLRWNMRRLRQAIRLLEECGAEKVQQIKHGGIYRGVRRIESDEIAAKRRKKRKSSFVYMPFVPFCGYSPLPVCSQCKRLLSNYRAPRHAGRGICSPASVGVWPLLQRSRRLLLGFLSGSRLFRAPDSLPAPFPGVSPATSPKVVQRICRLESSY